MSSRLTRRMFFPMLGSFGIGTLGAPTIGHAREEKASEADAATFTGTWTYRSFLSNPDIEVDFNKLEFARATLLIDKAPFGVLGGRLSFGDDFLSLKGGISYGNPFTARFQGKGDSKGTKGWVYDYLGFLVPKWPDGIEQRPAIVGTVIRTVAHSDGKAKAGVVASFIAVKRDP